MRAFILALIIVPKLSFAAPAWLHLVAKEHAAYEHITRSLDEMLGEQRAVHYGSALESNADYIFDDQRIDAVLALLHEVGTVKFQIRRPTARLGEWFEDSPLGRPFDDAVADEVLLKAARRSLAQLQRLDNLVTLNQEAKTRLSQVPDGTELQRCARTMGREIIDRLGSAHRTALDVFILIHGSAFKWAARDMLERDNYLYWRYLAEISKLIRGNRQTMPEFSRHHPEHVKRAWRQAGLDFELLGVRMSDAASDSSVTPRINQLQERGTGAALLRLTTLDFSRPLRSLENAIRSWYAPIETHVAARNEAAQFDRFATSMNKELARRAWVFVRAGTPLPNDLVEEYARLKGIPEETASKWLRFDASDALTGIMRVDGDLVFGKFLSEVAYGGQMVSEAYPGDRVRLLRYNFATAALFWNLLSNDPPKHPGTRLALLEYATLTRRQMRELLTPEEIEGSALGVLARGLRKQVVEDLRNFDFEECQATLSPRGLVPALRRFRKTPP